MFSFIPSGRSTRGMRHRALPGMPAASKRGARRRSAVSTRLRSCPNRRHLGGCCGAAAGGATTGRQIRRSGHPSAIHRERNEGAAVGDSPPLVPVSQSWLHRRCAHRGARGRGRRRLLFRTGALFTPEGTAKYISLHLSYRRPGVQPLPSLSEIVLDFGTCEVMNNMQYVIWRYDSPAMGVLDADEAELICAAQIADFLSLPARVVAPPWMRHMGWAGELVEEVD